MYICNAQGDVLLWNDGLTHEDDLTGIMNAGLGGIELPAGSYTLMVGGSGHRTSGYELIVESAE